MASSEPQDERTVRKGDRELTFYPGFASRVTLRDANGTSHALFEQSETYKLPRGRKRPDSEHKLRLRSGARKQDITVRVDDPELRIARITIELYGEEHDPEQPHDTRPEPEETFVVENWAKRCPPDCDPEDS